MCGITGIYNYSDQKPIDRHLAAQMVASITHRGPDDEGQYFDEKAGLYLGHRRLSIIDITGGHQPMSNEDGKVWIAFNGEIYNFPDLRPKLEGFGHRFRTRSDTETIIHGYEQWGIEGFSRLNGMYAFAIWNGPERTLVLARDPFGIKPLYYWDNGRTLVWGSEIKAILPHPAVEREVDVQALCDFLMLTYVPSPRTTFRGISKLPPGHFLLCTPRGVQLKRFYQKPPVLFSARTESDLLEELRDKIFRAVRRQMIADVPVGAMLSGGVDSSTLATIMSELSGEPIKTFTVGFVGDFEYNELAAAETMAQRIGSDHHQAVMSSGNFTEVLPRAIWHLEEPVATASLLAFYDICRLARQHVKVVLTGQGADEPFAGYHRHLGEYYGKFYRTLPGFIRNDFVAPLVNLLPRNERLKRAVSSLDIADPLQRFIRVYHTLDESLRNSLFREGLTPEQDDSLYRSVQLWQSDVSRLDGLSQMLYLDARLSLADNLLMYGDKMSMAVSLEARVPFLDLELMEFVESIPPQLKIKGLTQKYLLKKAASKWIPEEVIHRKKIGFTTPVDDWFQMEMGRTVEERLLAPGSACRMFLQPETVRRMLAEHQNRQQDYKRALFSLLTFEMWYEQFIKPSHWQAVLNTETEVA